MATINTFGAWVKAQRRRCDLTQAALAQSVGCSTVMIRKIERDERNPSQQLALLLATRLNIPTAERTTFLRMARGYTPAKPPATSSSGEIGYNTPVTVLSHPAWWIVSFIWPHDLRYYVGYRACEFTLRKTDAPLTHPKRQKTQPPPSPDHVLPMAADWRSEWLTDYANTTAPEKTAFRTFVDCSAQLSFYLNEGKQFVEIRYLPESNGVRIWLTVKTWETVTGAFILAQCLRFGNGLLSGFRQTISAVPFLSEYLMQMSGNANSTLTWLRQDGAWQPFPVPFTRYHTPAGEGVYEDSRGATDLGLVVRETPPRQLSPLSYQQRVAPDATWETFSAGWYWQRAVAISNRHPADCIHVAVDVGPLQAGASRTVEGKFYWLEGTKDDLLAVCQAEFSLS